MNQLVVDAEYGYAALVCRYCSNVDNSNGVAEEQATLIENSLNFSPSKMLL